MASGSSSLLETWDTRLTTSGRIVDELGAHDYPVIDAEARRIARALLAAYTPSSRGASSTAASSRATSLAGERVALLAPAGAEFIAAFFGILMAGGCVVLLSPLHPAAESIYVCTDARVKTILVGRGMAEKAEAIEGAWLTQSLDDLRAHSHAHAPGSLLLPPSKESDPALQLYTSGTTGKPKGAVLTHANLGVQQKLLGEAWKLDATHVLLHALPLHHLHGIGISLLAALGAGMGVHFLGAFDAVKVWDAMDKCTTFMGVPTMYAKLLSTWEGADEKTRGRWSHSAHDLLLYTSGSAALPTATGERWRSVTGHYPLERFGMTEVGVALSNPWDALARRPGTIGRALPTTEMRIVRDDGTIVQELSANDASAVTESDSGELQLRGPSVFAGYFGRDEANRDAFVVDPDGGVPWFKTGDTVAYDQAGYVRVLGRSSVDILKSGGYKLSALEIEAVIREHPAVGDVAVIGIADPTWGEVVTAVVIPRLGRAHECTGDILGAYAKEKLAAYKVPRQWHVRDELPRTAVGKVKKRELAAELTSKG